MGDKSLIDSSGERATKLRSLIKADVHQTSDEEAKAWEAQAKVLEGVDGKMLFCKVAEQKKIVKPRVGDLRSA